MITLFDIEKQVDEWIGSDPEHVENILSAIETACTETSNHLSANWQDREAARAWLRIADRVASTRRYVNLHKPY